MPTAKYMKTWAHWQQFVQQRYVDDASCTGSVCLARICTERKRFSNQGKGSDCDVRYEWRDLQSFHALYVEQIRASTAFYFEVIDCERPCQFYASFPVNENTLSLNWLGQHVTPVLIEAVRRALVIPSSLSSTPSYWSDGTIVNVYWDELTFTTPVMCGRFVQASILKTLEARGVRLNMAIYPTDESDWTRPRLVRFPFSGKRLGGKAVGTLRPMTGTNSTTQTNDLIADIQRATVAVTERNPHHRVYTCVVDSFDERPHLIPKTQT